MPIGGLKVKQIHFLVGEHDASLDKGAAFKEVFGKTTYSLPAFGMRGDVNPGEVTRIAFTPDKTGKFQYLCDIFCGEGHEDVTGTLIVTE